MSKKKSNISKKSRNAQKHDGRKAATAASLKRRKKKKQFMDLSSDESQKGDSLKRVSIFDSVHLDCHIPMTHT